MDRSACGGRDLEENRLGYGLRGDITPVRDHLPPGRESGGAGTLLFQTQAPRSGPFKYISYQKENTSMNTFRFFSHSWNNHTSDRVTYADKIQRLYERMAEQDPESIKILDRLINSTLSYPLLQIAGALHDLRHSDEEIPEEAKKRRLNVYMELLDAVNGLNGLCKKMGLEPIADIDTAEYGDVLAWLRDFFDDIYQASLPNYRGEEE